METSTGRYAIYFAPSPASALWRFGSRTIGYDAANGMESAPLAPPGCEDMDWMAATDDPRRYGFHATLKAPFSLREKTTAAELIDARIAGLGDWRGQTLARVRALIHEALPDVQETWKWRGTPVWEHGGILCTGETYRRAVKLTFANGAALPDPKGLFNASLEGNTRRAIDIHEGTMPDAGALKALVRAAAKHNAAKKKR